MSREIRGPVGGKLVEVTTRTLHSTFLLRPSPTVNGIVVGVLARAQRRYRMTVCAPVAMANHLHILLVPESAKQLADFMRYLNSNLARKIGRLYGWKEKFWGRPYSPITVSDEPQAQAKRLAYLLSHGAKEHLVQQPQQWPGVHAVEALLSPRPCLLGEWHDLTAESQARRRGLKIRRRRFTQPETLYLSPIPCWNDLSPEERIQATAELLRHIQDRIDAERRAAGLTVMGVEGVLSQDPLHRPKSTKKTPAPRFHAATKRVYQEMLQARRHFVAAYREASKRLRQGQLDVAFPPGCFPPGLAFVPEIDPSPD